MIPRPAPRRWPYREQRTLEEIDSPHLTMPRGQAERAGEALLDRRGMAVRSGAFLDALARELRA